MPTKDDPSTSVTVTIEKHGVISSTRPRGKEKKKEKKEKEKEKKKVMEKEKKKGKEDEEDEDKIEAPNGADTYQTGNPRKPNG